MLKNIKNKVMNRYEVYYEFDSYEGSPFKETGFSVETAFNEEEARGRVRSRYGSKKGFRINDVRKIK